MTAGATPMSPHGTCDICSPHQSGQTPFISFLPFLDSVPSPRTFPGTTSPVEGLPANPASGLFLGELRQGPEGRNGPSRSKTVPQVVGIPEPAKGLRWGFGLWSREEALHCTPRMVAE